MVSVFLTKCHEGIYTALVDTTTGSDSMNQTSAIIYVNINKKTNAGTSYKYKVIRSIWNVVSRYLKNIIFRLSSKRLANNYVIACLLEDAKDVVEVRYYSRGGQDILKQVMVQMNYAIE